MKLSEIMLVVFVGVLCSTLGYFASEMKTKTEMIQCKVKRVVEGSDENAVAKDQGTIQRPYTVLVYDPPYHTIVVPGIAGVEDERVWITPPW